MPKIEVHSELFFGLLGKRFGETELEAMLPVAKAEYEGSETGTLTFELNDTNRPDLWSGPGLARQLRTYRSGDLPIYDFFSSRDTLIDCGTRTVIVDPRLRDIRPYIAAFEIEGPPLNDAILKDLVQSQEKLCRNYGRRRRTIAMGMYRCEPIRWPVHYEAVDPTTTHFVPLGFDRALNLHEILEQHPKGKEFGVIVSGLERFPYIRDDRGATLSFPPVINSADIGTIEIGDSRMFVELTGDDMQAILTACAIVACDCADLGYTIHPVRIEYAYDTPIGRSCVTPYYFQMPVSVEMRNASRLLGRDITDDEACACLKRMGVQATVPSKGIVSATPPPYRNDFMHPVDVIEDIMIGAGMDSFPPLKPTDYTIGRLTAIEEFSRRIKSILVGLGFQEMIFSYLVSHEHAIARMYTEEHWKQVEDDIVRIANPMSKNYEYVRNSILPSLLNSESISANAVYPHRMFEIGKIARCDKTHNCGSRTIEALGILSASNDSDFNFINAQLSALLYYMDIAYNLTGTNDPRFIAGRGASIVCNEVVIGIMGEIHPLILENWTIQVPCVCAEIDINELLSIHAGGAKNG